MISTSFNTISLDRHGNNCAGVISGVANNNVCGVGLAYDAKIAGKFYIFKNYVFSEIRLRHDTFRVTVRPTLACGNALPSSLCLSRKEGIIHLFVRSRVNKNLEFFLIGPETVRMIRFCRDWLSYVLQSECQ